MGLGTKIFEFGPFLAESLKLPQNLQFTTVKMAYVTCLVTKNFIFELPGKCVKDRCE